MLQMTLKRLASLFKREQILVVTLLEYKNLILEQAPHLPPENLLFEPVSRNTAASIGWAAALIKERDPDGVMVALPADHWIADLQIFLKTLQAACSFAASQDCLVTFAIPPTRPETEYGYLWCEPQAVKQSDPPIYPVRAFIEKPSYQKAVRFLSLGNYYWNSGIFIWQAQAFWERFRKLLPDHAAGLDVIARTRGKEETEFLLAEIYPRLPAISVDYGIMEKAAPIYAVRGNFGWDDVGGWASLARILPRDLHGNVVRGCYHGRATQNCIVNSAGPRIVTLGVRGLVIAATPELTFVAAQDRLNEIKDLLQEIDLM
jgi:mannose-1-phosphate guanylyltransferase